MLRQLLRIFVIAALVAGVAAGGAGADHADALAGRRRDPADPFFDDSVLHDIFLTINSRDWASLKEHFLDNTYYPGDFKWNGQTVRNIGIRSRGTGSRSGVKPGLRVDFDRYTTDQKFLGLKSFILRNNTQDPSGMRERLSMELFKRMGLVAEREAHARLYINNAYVGLFTIVESLDKTFLTKNFNENDGHLYEYSFDNAAPRRRSTSAIRARIPALYTPVPFKPETLELDPQGEVLERLFWTVNVASDAVWRSSMEEFLDLKKFIRHLGDRELPRRGRRPHRRLRAEQLLLLPLREQEPLHVPAVGQEQHVLGEPVVLHLPQHRGRHGEPSATGSWCGR